MSFEAIEVRAVVQITLRLVELGGARVIIYVLLLVWCHYDSVSIIGITVFHVHFDDLHEAGTLVHLSELLLKFVED